MTRLLALIPFAMMGCSSSTTAGDLEALTPGQPTSSITCPTPAIVDDVGTVHQFVGDNGSFIDSCDVQGDLVMYACDTVPEEVCDEFECYETDTATSSVASKTVDCLGTCASGQCESVCPESNDTLRFDGGSEAELIVTNLTSNVQYTCARNSHCDALPPIGSQETIEYFGAPHDTCMGMSTFGASIAGCSLECSMR
jgi:hypothetical protein